MIIIFPVSTRVEKGTFGGGVRWYHCSGEESCFLAQNYKCSFSSTYKFYFSESILQKYL